MLKISEKLDEAKPHDCTLTLAFDVRQKSRFKAVLDDGVEVALILPRGSVLRSGDLLRAEDGKIVLINAASELVSYVATDDAHLMARACYHLGNRHVPLHIGEGWLRYAHDHVLDDMLHGLGLHAEVMQAPFEPEAGAYGGHAAHTHEHEHDQSREHHEH
jgi:urease accessory protein